MTIALGIGLNAAIFSVVHAVLWRSLPYPDAARIVVIEADTRALPSAYHHPALAFDVREQSRLITSIAQAEGRDASLQIDGVMERVAAARVTDDLLPLLGATPLALGRTLVTAEDADGIVGQRRRDQPRAVAASFPGRSSSDRPAADGQQLRRAGRRRHAARLSPRSSRSEPRRGARRCVVAKGVRAQPALSGIDVVRTRRARGHRHRGAGGAQRTGGKLRRELIHRHTPTGCA